MISDFWYRQSHRIYRSFGYESTLSSLYLYCDIPRKIIKNQHRIYLHTATGNIVETHLKNAFYQIFFKDMVGNFLPREETDIISNASTVYTNFLAHLLESSKKMRGAMRPYNPNIDVDYQKIREELIDNLLNIYPYDKIKEHIIIDEFLEKSARIRHDKKDYYTKSN